MAEYHVTLDGQGYMIDPLTYRKSVASPFAPKQRQGDPGYGDLTRFSVWALTDWRGGMGFATFDPRHPDRFDQAPGIDVAQGDIRLGRDLTSVHNPGSATTTDTYAFCVYKGVLYAGAASHNNIFASSDGTSWATVRSPASYTGIKAMCVFNGNLTFADTASGRIGTYDGTTWTDTWVTIGSCSGIRALANWAPYGATPRLYVGASMATGLAQLIQVTDTGATNLIHQSSLAHIEAIGVWGGQLVWAPMSDTAGYRGEVLAFDGAATSLLAVLADNAVASFCVYQTPSAPRPATSVPSTGTPAPGPAQPQVEEAIAAATTPTRYPLLMGSRTGGVIWVLGGPGIAELFHFPDVAGIGSTYPYTHPIRGMVFDNGRLWVPVVETNGLGIYVYDGHGWSYPSAGAAGQEPRAIISYNNALLISNKSSAGAQIYKTATTAPTTARWLITPWFDAGLVATDKVLLSVTVQHSALAADESVEVQYALDGGAYVSLGTSDTDGATSKTFSFAAATTCKRIRFKVLLDVASGAATPAVTAMLLTYVVATDAKAEWTFDVLLEGTEQLPLILEDQAAEATSGAVLANTLWASKAKKQTVAFTDLDGEAKTVFMVDVEERVSERSQRLGWSTRARVRLTEA